MSVPSCFLIFLLCLSLRGCNARRSAAIDKQEKTFHISNQKEISVAREVEFSFSSNKQVVKVESIEGAISDDKADEKLTKNGIGKKTSDSVDQNDSVGSVSWLVPKPKRGAKHPGFNLDYSPPKTHPPSHN